MTRDSAPLEGFPEPYGLLAAILQDGTKEWRDELFHRPDVEAMAWQTRPGGPSIGSEILHMIAVEAGWIEQFCLGREISAEDKKALLWDETNVDEGFWAEAPREPFAWYCELQDRYRIRTLEAIKSLPSPETARGSHGSGFTMRWVLGHVIQHEAYHGGQIVMLYDQWQRMKKASEI